MRIAYVCNEYPPRPHGGIGTVVQTIARSFAQADHQVYVVGLGDSETVTDDLGVVVHTLNDAGVSRASELTSRYKLHRWLARKAAEREIDIVEAPDFGGTLPLSFPHCTVVVRLHMTMTCISAAADRHPSRFLKIFERGTLRHHRNWIAVSRYVHDLTVNAFHVEPQLSTVIHNPFLLAPEDAVSGLPEKYVLFGGSVCAVKGAYTLAEAARLFLPRYPDVHLVYAGKLVMEDGRPADSTIADIVGCELLPRIHFLGRISRGAYTYCLRRASLFAFPSILEAFPLVVGEAMLAGVPVVVTDIGPFPELVTHEQTGLLVPPKDSVALAESISRLLEAPSFRQDLSRRAQSTVQERFTLKGCIDATEEFYRTCLERFRSSHPGT